MIKKILKHFSNALLYAFAGITLILLVLSLSGIKPYITVSGSMEPNIMTGSVCFVNTNAKYENVEMNDIIAFNAGNTLVTHRVVNFTSGGLQTKGDNNEEPDTIITTNSNFVGKTLCSIPVVGYIVMFFKTPIGLSAIGLILLLLIVFSIKDFPNSKNKTTRNNNTILNSN